jgi:hypothetical protein
MEGVRGQRADDFEWRIADLGRHRAWSMGHGVKDLRQLLELRGQMSEVRVKADL